MQNINNRSAVPNKKDVSSIPQGSDGIHGLIQMARKKDNTHCFDA